MDKVPIMLHTFSQIYKVVLEKKMILLVSLLEIWWPAWILNDAELCHSEALQLGHAASEIF